MRRKPSFPSLALLAASIGMGSAFGAAPIPVQQSKNAILSMPSRLNTKKQIAMMKAGGSPYRTRNPWPYSGKNRTQRQNLTAAFASF